MGKSKRLRSPRYRPAEFRLGSLQALYKHGGQPAGGDVLDFSGQGLALAVPGDAGVFLSGDSLPYLRVYRGAETFYEGAAVVRHVREDQGSTILGLAFQNAWMDMGKLYAADLRLDVEQRFGTFFSGLAMLDRIDPRFKAWVADVKYFLDELRSQLEGEEKRIQDLDLITREAVSRETVDLVARSATRYLNDRIAELNELVSELEEPQHQLYRGYFQHHLNARFLESPFMARALQKPLGYAGDYEVMNMLYRDHREGASLFGQVLNVFACGLTAAQANINRISFLADRVAEFLRDRPGASIVSIGCGPAMEIRELIRRHPELGPYNVTLMDIEPLAIQHCEKVLLPELRETDGRVQVHLIRESVRQLIRQERLDEVLDPQDLVISAGLFDYFGNKMFQHLLQRLYGLLRPGGQMLIGNVNVENDTRYFMEYMAEWFLHHRSPALLQQLASVLPYDADVEVVSEPTGVNLFLRTTKRAAESSEEEPLAAIA